MYFYLAGSFNRRTELREYAEALSILGHHVTSRWLFDDAFDVRGSGTDDIDMDLQPSSPAEYAATCDLEDIDAAGGMIFFSSVGYGRRGRGGRHVEYGYILREARQGSKLLVIIGARENAFHSLVPKELKFDNFDEFIKSTLFMDLRQSAAAMRIHPST